MFPVDSEFTMLYIAYLLMIGFLSFGLLKSNDKAFYKWNFLFFGIYFLIMIYVFSDAENFRYGNSLVVLFYGGIFVISHFVIIGILRLYKLIRKK
jgi:hypothetical protein